MTISEISLPAPHNQSEHMYGPRLVGVWRIASISAWAIIWLICLGAFLVATYDWYVWDSTPITEFNARYPWAINLDSMVGDQEFASSREYDHAIEGLGMSLTFYGGLFAGMRLLACIPYFLLSALIVHHRSERLMVVIFAIILAVLGAAGRPLSPNWTTLPGAWVWSLSPGLKDLTLLVTADVRLLLSFVLNCSIILFFIFPDGRFVPRWTRWLALYVVLISFTGTFLPNSPLNPGRLPWPTGSMLIQLPNLIAPMALIYRYHRRADAVQKQQLKWMVPGAVLLMVAFFAHFAFLNTPLLSGLNWTQRLSLIITLADEIPFYVVQIVLAVCISVSLYRYHLWELDLVVNRLLVYGSLTLLTIGIYMGAVVGIGSLFRSMTSPAVFFVATGIIAILVEPMRRRLQRLVNRLLYGERDDPYRVLTRLANSLEHSATPSEVLPTIAETVSQTLKIPYVAIQIQENGVDHQVAQVGQAQEEKLIFPLFYQAELIGSLHVGRRAPGEGFSKADLRLLENIARQAGSAAETVRLNAELVRSRAGIVTAREEERRRLRRDLHDGLGPILASQTLKMAAVRQLVRQSPERAETLVDDVIHQNESTITEVRRLVYGLRPPALDELGLVEAVRDLVHRSVPGDHIITVDGPEGGLPKLPAAVEANAYRIALEGLTNVARHAQAKHCDIHFALDEQPNNGRTQPMLVVQICDDGSGMPKQYRAGVGLRSMRERAEELGGQFLISAISPHGTQVSARLPLMEW